MNMLGDKDYVIVELHPFAHQVGGHTCVLELNSSVICKPFDSNEVWFYENEPEEMKEFTPRFLGEVDVKCDMGSSKKCLHACLPRRVAVERGLVTFDPPNVVQSTHKRNRKRKHKTNSSSTSEFTNTDENSSTTGEEYMLSVWSIQCIEKQISRHGFWANNKPQKFIMLENLVGKYKKPCMLDLKMGRRQYGNTSSFEKRKLLEERCANSTSTTLGFRVCGMQVYQERTDNYVVHNKYHGRDLTVDGVNKELQFYFSNGVFVRKDAITLALDKLRSLQKLLETQKTFNFFACSLLLMYDGASAYAPVSTDNISFSTNNTCSMDITWSSHNTEESNATIDTSDGLKVDVRLIDFAHASARSHSSQDREADEGILFGIENLISILNSILYNQELDPP